MQEEDGKDDDDVDDAEDAPHVTHLKIINDQVPNLQCVSWPSNLLASLSIPLGILEVAKPYPVEC